jgi:hypothetical protein
VRFETLQQDNYLLFAIKYYDNPTALTSEDFNEDLKRFKYVKRWLKKYHETGEINTHLLLNHVIIIFNCWNDAAIPLLFYKINLEYWPYLKAFISYLDRVPTYPHSTIHDIEEDINIRNTLAGI